jgi:ABC-type glycerol-3-phosphate transport system substrate-binding protein
VERGPDGLTRIGFDPAWGWPSVVEAYFQANGVPLLSPEGDRIGFDTPAALEALQWVEKARAQIGPPAEIADYQKRSTSIGAALATGQLGMELMGVWDLAYTIYKTTPEAQINQFAMPGGPSAQGKTFGYFIANFCVIPTDAKQPEAAWAYARFTASPTGQLFVQRAPGAWDQACIPSVADDPESLKNQPWRKDANKLLAQAKSYAYFPYPGSSQIDGAIDKIIAPFRQGTQSAAETFTQLKQQVQIEMDNIKKS